MSYSFNVSGASKEEAKEKVKAELARVVEGQPSHTADQAAAQSTADTFIDLLRDPTEGQEVNVSVSGSLAWQEEGQFISTNVSVIARVN